MAKTQKLPVPPKGRSFVPKVLVNQGQKPAKRGENGLYPVRGVGGRG